MRTAKAFVKNVLLRLGFEIRRVNPKSESVSVLIDRERNATDYDRIWSEPGRLNAYLRDYRRQLYDHILDFASEASLGKDVNSIADVGCGMGYFTGLLAEYFQPQRLVGFDFSEKALLLARDICPRADFRQHDIYTPLDEKFDLLFCIEVLEHLAHPDKALDNLIAAAPRIVLTVPNGRVDTFGGHINYWSFASWKVFLKRCQNIAEFQSQFIGDHQRYIATWIRRKP